MNINTLPLLFIILTFMPAHGHAAQQDASVLERPKIALMLSAGGAPGLAHIGVLS
ncbi:hypothetical protein MNBD_GAMMA25-1931 [hydrothermal vent metagenome]|uniref:Uncharacterized protein n=1 Tax=hydrothermal vent metagenome TaxID=652676 RepID=A0A3B1AL15_9ZZZZ